MIRRLGSSEGVKSAGAVSGCPLQEIAYFLAIILGKRL
jgi:hypothetical protein